MVIDFRERRREGERQRERGDRNIDAREKHRSVASHTHRDRGLNPQPRRIGTTLSPTTLPSQSWAIFRITFSASFKLYNALREFKTNFHRVCPNHQCQGPAGTGQEGALCRCQPGPSSWWQGSFQGLGRVQPGRRHSLRAGWKEPHKRLLFALDPPGL